MEKITLKVEDVIEATVQENEEVGIKSEWGSLTGRRSWEFVIIKREEQIQYRKGFAHSRVRD